MILDYLIKLFFWIVFLPSFNGLILSFLNINITLPYLFVLGIFEFGIYYFFTKSSNIKSIHKFNHSFLSDVSFILLIIGCVFIFKPEIIKFFKSKNLLDYSDVLTYFRLLNVALEQGKFDLIYGGYQGLISLAYISSRIFGLPPSQSLNLTMGIYMVFPILIFFKIVKTVYDENPIIGILGILILLSFSLTLTNYTIIGYYGMLCAQFFILNSIYQYYFVIKNGGNAKNLFYFNGSIFMTIVTHPPLGFVNVFSFILVIIYTNFVLKKRLGWLFYILFSVSSIVPFIKYEMAGYFFSSLANKKMISFVMSLKGILLILAIIGIVVLTLYLVKRLINAKKYGLLLYGIFLIWISLFLILHYSNSTIDYSRWTEYLKSFGLTLFFLLPLKILESIGYIELKNIANINLKKIYLQNIIITVALLVTIYGLVNIEKETTQDSLIDNGSFDKWQNGLPENWGSNSLSKANKEAVICYGIYSACLSTGSSSGRLEQTLTDLKKTHGKVVRLTAYIQRATDSTVGIAINDGTSIVEQLANSPLNVFRKVVVTKKISLNAKKLSIYLNINATNAVAYFDEIKLELVK